jgi:hypothetical protein
MYFAAKSKIWVLPIFKLSLLREVLLFKGYSFGIDNRYSIIEILSFISLLLLDPQLVDFFLGYCQIRFSTPNPASSTMNTARDFFLDAMSATTVSKVKIFMLIM